MDIEFSAQTVVNQIPTFSGFQDGQRNYFPVHFLGAITAIPHPRFQMEDS